MAEEVISLNDHMVMATATAAAVDTTARPLQNERRRVLAKENISAVFFDLDNTLIPTRAGDARAVRKIADALESVYELSAECAALASQTFLREFRACPDNVATPLDEWRTTLWHDALPTTHKHLAAQLYRRWLRLRYRYVSLSEEHAQLLLRMRAAGYALALITNGPSNAQWEKVRELRLRQYFDCILVSGDLPWEKPHPNIFRVASDFLNVRPHECVMVGDKLETDIKGGLCASLGLTIWTPLNTADLLRELPAQTRPDVRLSNLMQLVEWLPKLRSGALNLLGGIGGLAATATTTVSTNRQLYSQRRNLQLKQHLKQSRHKRRGSLPAMECFSSETENSCDSLL